MSVQYFRGVPTDPDVDRLMGHFDDLKPGDIAKHEEIESVTGNDRYRTMHRYRTVVASWKNRLLRERNIKLRTLRGIGYEVVAGDSRLEVNTRGYQLGIRACVRHATEASMIDDDELSETCRRTKQRLLLNAGALKMVNFMQPRKVEMPK